MYRVFSGDDVSEASGVRCEPIEECEYNHNPDKINLVEMNLFVGDPTKYHFSMYPWALFQSGEFATDLVTYSYLQRKRLQHGRFRRQRLWELYCLPRR